MKPLQHFELVWERSDHLAGIYTYLSSQVTSALKIEEILRAEWVSRVSALDLYVHELVAQRMVEIFEGQRLPSLGFHRFTIPVDILMRIKNSSLISNQRAAFDLEVRNRLGFITYQDPEKISDGIRQISDIELWNSIAVHQGATAVTKVAKAKSLKLGLSLIVERRNKIAHEGDLQPNLPRDPWPICRADVDHVATYVRNLVQSIEAIV